ncbi:hypothetical protein AcV5_009993 [Taiwanofungus camphoratus]|nr:hypothetical protein AcV5_009993 [Antrodia cinnamomea]KAI0920189.1 hypothetical protein AcV5_009993 [Antrodia cinnamomea]KAI0945880.1 hypothetical protein AcV7_010001 [Antrodia cinnamomea]
MPQTSWETRFPLELYERSIDYLWDDHEALAECSLTCRALLLASRYHLFHTVKLKNRDDCLAFEALVDFSTRASTGLAEHVRDLTVPCLGPEANETSVNADMEWRQVELLLRLNRVAHLTLNDVTWHALRERSRIGVLTALRRPALQTLHVGLLNAYASDIMHILFGCRTACSLQALALSWGAYNRCVRPPALFTDGRAALARAGGPESGLVVQELVVDTTNPRAGGWLEFFPFPLRLRSLEWRCLGARDRDRDRGVRLAALLEDGVLGDTLRQLTISRIDPISAFPKVDLSRLTRLAELHLHWRAHKYGMELGGGVFTAVPPVLSQLRSAHLQEIKFTINTRKWETSYLDCLQLEKLDEVLSGLAGACPSLVVVFVFYSSRPAFQDSIWEELTETMKARLCKLVSRGTRVKIIGRTNTSDEPGEMRINTREHWLSRVASDDLPAGDLSGGLGRMSLI